MANRTNRARRLIRELAALLAKRNALVVALRQEGETLAAIGGILGMSRQRVHQIVATTEAE